MITKVAYYFLETTVNAVDYTIRLITDSRPKGPDRDSSEKKALLEALMTQFNTTDGPAYLVEIYKRRAESFELFQALHSYHLREEIQLQDRIRTLMQRWCMSIPPTDKDFVHKGFTNAAHDLQEIQDVIKLLQYKVYNRRYLRSQFGADGRSKRLKLPDEFYGTTEVNALLFEGWEMELREMRNLGVLLERRA